MRAVILRAAVALTLALALGACDDSESKSLDLGDIAEQPGPATGSVDGGGPAAPLTACVERPPGAAPAPAAPSGALPCELLPPGFGASR